MPRPPGDPEDPIAPVGGPGTADASGSLDSATLDSAVDQAGATSGVEGAVATGGTDAAAATTAVDASSAVQGDADLARALSAGEISPAQAQQALIEQAVESQLPEGATPAERELLRAELEAVLASDPTLAGLLGS